MRWGRPKRSRRGGPAGCGRRTALGACCRARSTPNTHQVQPAPRACKRRRNQLVGLRDRICGRRGELRTREGAPLSCGDTPTRPQTLKWLGARAAAAHRFLSVRPRNPTSASDGVPCFAPKLVGRRGVKKVPKDHASRVTGGVPLRTSHRMVLKLSKKIDIEYWLKSL